MVSATMLAALSPDKIAVGDENCLLAAMAQLSASAFCHYRKLVSETKGFRTFLRQRTPINEIATLKIGSRPASRKSSEAIENLRAIPWIFSWAQARVMLPGWYGTGHEMHDFADNGLLAVMAARGLILKRYLRIWKWFWQNRIWISPAYYAGLVEDQVLSRAVIWRD